MRDGSKLLGFVVAVIALGLVVAVAGTRLLGLAAGPEVELITQLKRAERGVDLRVGSALLAGGALQYQRLSVVVEPSGERALVTGTLDFTGTFDGTTRVSALGLERIPFELRDGDWVATDGYAPRLCAIVKALDARRRGLDSGAALVSIDGGVDPGVATLRTLEHRSFRAEAWFIRSEREQVEIAEDYRLTGDGRDRPIDEQATKRLTLLPDGLGGFRFEAVFP